MLNNKQLLENLEMQIKENKSISFNKFEKNEGNKNWINIKKGVYFQIGHLKKTHFFYFNEKNDHKYFRNKTFENKLEPNLSNYSEEENNTFIEKEILEPIKESIEKKEIFFDENDKNFVFKDRETGFELLLSKCKEKSNNNVLNFVYL